MKEFGLESKHTNSQARVKEFYLLFEIDDLPGIMFCVHQAFVEVITGREIEERRIIIIL